jgi:P-type Cu2+ transporter
VITLGRDTLAKIRQNLAWAMLYNVVGVPVAAGVLLPSYGIALSPSVAGGMMAFSSVAVVSNSLLLSWQWQARLRSLRGDRRPGEGRGPGPEVSHGNVAGQAV